MGRVLAKQPLPDPPRPPQVCFGICPVRKEWRNRPSLSPLENCQVFKEQFLLPWTAGSSVWSWAAVKVTVLE